MFKVNGYTYKGSNPAIFFLHPFLKVGGGGGGGGGF